MKSIFVAYLLWLIGMGGILGFHRFYLGRWVSGLLWFFTGGLFLVGALIDLLLVPEMVRVENLSRQLLHEASRNRHGAA